MKAFHRAALASLPLQIALYYNCVLYVLFATLIGAASVQKVLHFNRLISISLLVVWTVIEPFRIYLGMKGNMGENVPDTATYLLMTLFPQLPITFYLAYFQPTIFPVDPVLGSIMVIFLLLELTFGVLLIRKQIHMQTIQFESSIERLD